MIILTFEMTGLDYYTYFTIETHTLLYSLQKQRKLLSQTFDMCITN